MSSPLLVICNSSPIISLQRIGRLDLLDGHFDQIVVPEAVAREVGALPSFMAVWPLPESGSPLETPASIHAGEGEVLLLGVNNPGAVLILDDGPARRFAAGLGLLVTGTLGLLIRCKQQGRLDQIAPLVDDLLRVGSRWAPDVRARALRLAGEAS